MGDLFEPMNVRDAIIAGWMAGTFVSVGWTCYYLKNMNENLAQIVIMLRDRKQGRHANDD